MGHMNKVGYHALVNNAISLLLPCLLFLAVPELPRAETGGPLLKEVAANISQYKGQRLTLLMKLKYFDSTFEKIVFYDARKSQNLDIEFDVSTKEKKKLLSADMEVLHEGVDYYVTFVVEDLGSKGLVTGNLQGFVPAFLENLPEKRRPSGDKPGKK